MNPRRYEHERYEEQRSEAARRYRPSEDPYADGREARGGSYPSPRYEDPRHRPEHEERSWESGEDVGGHHSWPGPQYDESPREARGQQGWEPASSPYGPPPPRRDEYAGPQGRGYRSSSRRDPYQDSHAPRRDDDVDDRSHSAWRHAQGGNGGSHGGWSSGPVSTGPMQTQQPASGRCSFRGKGPRGYLRSDSRIKEDICERLMEDDAIDASDIEVDVANGEVTLSGTVDRRDVKRHVEDVVEEVMGIKHVQNNIRVEKDKASDDRKDWEASSSQTTPPSLHGSGTGAGFPSSGASAKQRVDTKANL